MPLFARSSRLPAAQRITPLAHARTGAPLQRARRWGWLGAVLGLLLTLLLCAPASWLAAGLERASQGRLQLLSTQGPWWDGSALPMLTGGPGSRDAMLLPSRLHWRLSLGWGELRLALQQDCCAPAGLSLRARPRWGHVLLQLDATASPAQWPAAWLEGLGAPWNTLKPGGQLALESPGLSADWSAQGLHLDGRLQLTLSQTSSRLATVEPLGDYRITLQASGGQPTQVQLKTLSGPLQLEGNGQIGPRGLRLRGTASAAPEQAPALNNLLNLIGRRQGAQSILSIG
jgi:general secretion pathway protein N